jgi:hypothetical protein
VSCYRRPTCRCAEPHTCPVRAAVILRCCVTWVHPGIATAMDLPWCMRRHTDWAQDSGRLAEEASLPAAHGAGGRACMCACTWSRQGRAGLCARGAVSTPCAIQVAGRWPPPLLGVPQSPSSTSHRVHLLQVMEGIAALSPRPVWAWQGAPPIACRTSGAFGSGCPFASSSSC